MHLQTVPGSVTIKATGNSPVICHVTNSQWEFPVITQFCDRISGSWWESWKAAWHEKSYPLFDFRSL